MEYYVLYGIDAIDDYIKLLSAEEFEKIEKAIEKFSETEEVFDFVEREKVKRLINNVLYLAPTLIEKGEVVIDSPSLSLQVPDEGGKLGGEESTEIITNIIKNAELISKVSVELLKRFKALRTEIFVFKLIIAG